MRACHLKGLVCYAVQAEVSHLPFRWQVRDENLASGLCYTSGTTGNPKVHTHSPPGHKSCIIMPHSDWAFSQMLLGSLLKPGFNSEQDDAH